MKIPPPARSLPEKPDLDQLRRQAKELLTAFRKGEAAAIREVTAHCRGADPETLALHDAQLALARSYGFQNWPKLKALVDGATVGRLCAAVRAGDIARARAMLAARPELAGMDLSENNEHRAIHFAVFDRSVEMVWLLMQHGADARKGIYPHRDATRPLTVAIERGYDEIVAVIREEEERRREQETRDRSAAGSEARASKDSSSSTADDARAAASAGGESPPEPRTPQSAVAAGDVDWLRSYYAQGKLDPAVPNGLLAAAVKHNQPEVLSLLLDLGFDPDARTRVEGLEEVVYTWGVPLQLCAGLGRHAMAKLLLERGADPNGEVYAAGTAVSTAYRARDAAMLELLERHGGVVTAETAGYHRDTELARRLLMAEAGGYLQRGVVPHGQTVAGALLNGDCGDPEIVRMALERVNWARDDRRWYGMLRGPLSFWNHIPWIESEKWKFDRGTYLISFRLILERCHANLRGSYGRTILHDVVAMGRREGVRDWITDDEVFAFGNVLIDAGARLDVRDDLLKSTPLGWACRWGRLKLVKLMLERGADVVEEDAEPWAQPLAWAEKMGWPEVASVLREYGA